MNTNDKIRKAMRRNEVEVLAYVRRNRVWSTYLFSWSWVKAFDRLQKAGRVVYHNRKDCYVANKGAGPVTSARR